MTAQLTMDGGEVPMENLGPTRRTPDLSPAQKAILRFIGERGFITSTEAGHMLYEDVEPGYDREAHYRRHYAASDGLEAMKRLAARGVVRRDPEKLGRWLSNLDAGGAA